MVRIDRIVTRGGDKGQTSLGSGARVWKSDTRIQAIGAVDELNAAIGLLRCEVRGEAWADTMLARIQNDLFDLGADLCLPGAEGAGKLRVSTTQCARLETEIQTMNEKLAPLTSFVLPGGSRAAAQAHIARTVARRAERCVVQLLHEETAAGGGLNAAIVQYLNRVSDHLFVLARAMNDWGKNDVLWVPGQTR